MESPPAASPEPSGTWKTNPERISLRPSIWRRADASQRRDLEMLLVELERSSEFGLKQAPPTPTWELRLGLTHESLIVALVDAQGLPFANRSIHLEPMRALIRSYLSLIKRMGDSLSSHSMGHLEALDMARRSAHNEASQRIQEDLHELLEVDAETARRLFTVLCLVYDTPAL